MGPRRFRLGEILLLAGFAMAQTPVARDLPRMLDRLASEAEKFRAIAPEMLSEETLQQRSRPGIVGLLEKDRAVSKLPAVAFDRREIVSEYGFAGMRNAPGALHEMRKVIRVDGREISTIEDARHAMTMGLVSADDKQKKRMLEDFEKHGLKGAVTDFGQLILLFSKRRLPDYEFRIARETRVGVDAVVVLAYKQLGGPQSLTVFRGNNAVRQPLAGEIWVRESDGMPLHITLVTTQQMKNNAIRDEAAVDYSPGASGAILPVSVSHREFLNDELLSENTFRYAPFRRISGAAPAVVTSPVNRQPTQTVANPPRRERIDAPAPPRTDNIPIVKAPVVRVPE